MTLSKPIMSALILLTNNFYTEVLRGHGLGDPCSMAEFSCAQPWACICGAGVIRNAGYLRLRAPPHCQYCGSGETPGCPPISPPRGLQEVHPGWGGVLHPKQVRRPWWRQEQDPQQWRGPQASGPGQGSPGLCPCKCCPAHCWETPAWASVSPSNSAALTGPVAGLPLPGCRRATARPAGQGLRRCSPCQ